MSTHFALRTSVFILAGIIAGAVFASLVTVAHADGYYGNWYNDETYTGPTWDWNAQSGPGGDHCDGDWDQDDSACMFSPDYYGYGGYSYYNNYYYPWDSGIYFPMMW